ncbi:TetR family transcriptional regulator [Streptomyces sp. ID05-04B]|uniref:TetR/AcrR family transcriptional regulator n=1 Tax=unclassified Streptomyces TaxID=2593676 RepID=UPI000D1BB3E1|nr:MULTISPECIES: TetR family transcriptional regulator [unclassified Streptomyces]AVV40797.1 TetR family transcriptional regulator [Streptomyces sp. P3]MDX5563205.1 TetR family transcriptional regulator [Streptomyces sp. ID05-04B]
MSPMTAARISSPADRPRLGLRERKKIKTREAIRTATYALVREQGYDATTVDQIAERAEVSPSTVFRYFPTKEDIVLTDEYDPVLLEELRARPADEPWPESIRQVMLSAARTGIEDDIEVARLRTRLLVQVPAVRSRMMESMSVTGRMLCVAIAERTGRDPGSLEVRVHAMSLIGGLMETSMYWAENGHQGDFPALLGRALEVLEHGLEHGPEHGRAGGSADGGERRSADGGEYRGKPGGEQAPGRENP